MNNEKSKLLEIFSIAALLVGPLTIWLNWPILPETVPFHFNWLGQPDHFGPKLSILLLPVVSLLMYAGLSYGQRHPERSNVPWQVNESNRAKTEELIKELLGWLKLEVLVLFSYLQWATVNIALKQMDGLEPWFAPVMLVALFAPIAFFVISGNKLLPVKQR
jgi:hypothetical protein